MDVAHVAIALAVLVAWVATWLAAVRSIGSPDLAVTPLARGIWTAAVIVLPVVGPVLWFIAGRPYLARAAALRS